MHHHALLNYLGKMVIFPISDGQYLVFHGMLEARMPMISTLKVAMMMFKRCDAFLAYVVTTSGKYRMYLLLEIIRRVSR